MRRDGVIRGRLVTPDAVIEDGYVEVSEGRIIDVGSVDQLPGARLLGEPQGTVLPGLVDIHCHGGGGASFTAGVAEQIDTCADHHLRQGTTSLIASTVTDSPERMLAAVRSAAEAVARGQLVGIHLEGPFLSAGYCGAQDPRYLRDPDLGLTRELLEEGAGHVRVMTIAPELPGSEALVDLLMVNNVIPAVGHTQADAAMIEHVLSAHRAGLVTHLYNGMPPMHHRDPGPVGGSLTAAARGSARVELIADGVHLADATVRMTFSLLGADGVVLVTDAMAAAGMPDGDYVLGPQRVAVRAGVARLQEQGDCSIAGGTFRLLDVVRRCVDKVGVDLTDAVAAASLTPATALGMADQVGAIRAGLRADLLVVDEDLTPLRVMRSGSWIP